MRFNLDLISTKQGDLPDDLDALIIELNREIDIITAMLERGEIEPIVWQTEFERFLVRYHTAAYMTGQNSSILNEVDIRNIKGYVGSQLEFLDNFRMLIESTESFIQGWYSRADMYASSIKQSYWKGETKVLPLPAMPAEGTQCMTNCGCAWDIEVIDEERGDYNAYWVRGKRDSCQTCLERAAQWSPLVISGGELEIPSGMLG